MGFFACDILGNSTEQLSADILLASYFVGDEADACGKHCECVSVEIVTDLARTDIDPCAGSGDPLECQNRTIIPKRNNDLLFRACPVTLRIGKISLGLEQFAERLLEPRPRGTTIRVPSVLRIAHPGEKVADGI